MKTKITRIGTIALIASMASALGGCSSPEPPEPVKGVVVGAHRNEETDLIPVNGAVVPVTTYHYILSLDLNGDGEGDRYVEVDEELWQNVTIGDTYQRTTK